MEIQGKINQILSPKGGQSSRGSWKKQEFIIETNESFPKKICVANWNDKVDLSGFKQGDDVTFSVNIESREYNGNWYTDIKVWKAELNQPSASPTASGDDLPGLPGGEAPPPPWQAESEDSGQDDLPF